MALVWRDDLSLDLRRVRRSERALRRLLNLGRREVGLGDGPFRGLDLSSQTNTRCQPRMPAISSSATATIKNASHAARPAATRPNAAAK